MNYLDFISYMDRISPMCVNAKNSSFTKKPALYQISISKHSAEIFNPNACRIEMSPHSGHQLVANCKLDSFIIVTMYPVEATWYNTESGQIALEISSNLSEKRVSWYSKYFKKGNNILEYSISTSVTCPDALSIITVPESGNMPPLYACAHMVNDALPPEVYLQITKIFQKGVDISIIPEKAIHYFTLFYYIYFIKNGNCWFLKKTNNYVVLITNREIDNNTPLTSAYGLEYFLSGVYSTKEIMDMFSSMQRQFSKKEKIIYCTFLDYIIGPIIPHERSFEKSIESSEIQNLSISINISTMGDRLWILQNMIKPIILSYIQNKNGKKMMEFLKITQQIIPNIKISQYSLFLLYLSSYKK